MRKKNEWDAVIQDTNYTGIGHTTGGVALYNRDSIESNWIEFSIDSRGAIESLWIEILVATEKKKVHLGINC